MEGKNWTAVAEFVLLGLAGHLHQKIAIFFLLLSVYLITLGSNLGMITLIWLDPRLHSPMYFFLSHLSFVDICFSSSITPRTLCHIFAEKKSISFVGCAAQMWFVGLFVAMECFLLAAMAYDRYTAVCKPLQYTLIMSPWVCVQLVMGSYAIALINIITHTALTFSLPFCGPNTINHFFCDISPLLSLTCVDTWINNLVLFVLSGAIGVLSGGIIVVSYVCITVAVLQIHTAHGRWKVFSTCSSHLAAVSILYGTLFFIYVRPSSGSSLSINKVISVFYTMVIPGLNPLIYSLRNKEVKEAFKRNVERKHFLIGG
ncbi:olfactory receptor 5G3-like [Cavia porcellus]|uniref:Olfactory receptor n=1 Tax=Cavia porcellus TaxID=10141 RepID=H0W1E1_CAVPO|nr:olfactory receptor 5G3-like [Cavia porcellus]